MDFPEKYKKLWSYWDVRVLILASLFIQIILIFLGRLRKTSASRWIRMATWSSYLLADWVADFVLGKLSNAMDDSSTAILAFWAPFLILHLGGPDSITAYSIEDNELWARHLLGLGYELIIASYVFMRALPGNLLLAPTLLIFVVATIKYAERSYSLYNASSKGFRSSIASFTKKLRNDIDNIQSAIPKTSSEDFIRLKGLHGAFTLYSASKPFLIDYSPLFQLHEIKKGIVMLLSGDEVLRLTNMELSFAYDEIYTKAAVNHSRAGYILRVLCSICIVLAFLIFYFAPKHDFEKIDIIITYVLLSASICLDAAAGVMLVLSDWMIVSLLNLNKFRKWGELLARRIFRIRIWLGRYNRDYWFGEMPQLNLISNCLKNYAAYEAPKKVRLRSFAEKLGFVYKRKLRISLEHLSLKEGNFEDVTLHVLDPVSTDNINLDIIASYALKCLQVPWENISLTGVYFLLHADALAWVVHAMEKLLVGLTFDKMVLVWHIATELCYHWKPESLHPLHPRCPTEVETNEDRVKIKSPSKIMQACMLLSNYMMHMIMLRPEMLSMKRGSKFPFMFQTVCKDMMEFIRTTRDCDQSVTTAAKVEEVLCRELLGTPIEWDQQSPLLQISRVLALLLMLFTYEEVRWTVVLTVWVKFLMMGSLKTRASMHVKQLSRGGELLTFFWLLTKDANLQDALDPEASEVGDVLEIPKKLLSDIKLHLGNQL